MDVVLFFNFSDVGEEGIEPSHGGFKGPCLTAWLLPSDAWDHATIFPPRMLMASVKRGLVGFVKEAGF